SFSLSFTLSLLFSLSPLLSLSFSLSLLYSLSPFLSLSFSLSLLYSLSPLLSLSFSPFFLTLGFHHPHFQREYSPCGETYRQTVLSKIASPSPPPFTRQR